MKQKPLRTLFDATFHDKYAFEDFLSLDVSQQWDSQVVRARQRHLPDRRLHQPKKTLKAFHWFLNTFLFSYLSINERVVYSYRKGFNAQSAVARHAQNRAFFQADIRNFFDSLSRDRVRSVIATQSTTAPITDLAQYADRILEMTVIDDSLPIGFATSPPISNACLTGFDNDLEAYCVDRSLTYTRYADDLIVSAVDRKALADIQAVMAQLLDRHFDGRLQLKPSKSKLTTVGRNVKALGLVILPTGQVTIDREVKQRLEVLLHFYSRDVPTFVKIANSDYAGAVSKVSGLLNYVNANDQYYLEKLRRKFGATIVDSFIHKTVS